MRVYILRNLWDRITMFKVLLLVYCFTNDAFGHHIVKRIAGGSDAEQGQFPYQVSLRYSENGNAHFCGGSIADLDHVVTSARCIVQKNAGRTLKAEDIIVHAGSIYLYSTRTTTRNVSRIHVHEQFDKDSFENDVAVLTLFSSLPSNEDTIKKIRIRTSDVLEDTECTVSGWGWKSEEENITHPVLNFANIHILKNDVCNAAYNQSFNDDFICAGEDGKGVCKGDTGGPFVCNDQLTGITSWGIECGLRPRIFSKVSSFAKWIKDIIKNDEISSTTQGATTPETTTPSETTTSEQSTDSTTPVETTTPPETTTSEQPTDSTTPAETTTPSQATTPEQPTDSTTTTTKQPTTSTQITTSTQTTVPGQTTTSRLSTESTTPAQTTTTIKIETSTNNGNTNILSVWTAVLICISIRLR